MRVLKVLLILAALPLAGSAAQSAQGAANRRDPCTLPEGGIRRGAPDAARDVATSRNKGKTEPGLTGANSVNCAPTTPPPPPPPPPPPSDGAQSEIQGTVFADNNASFVREADEPGLGGWSVTLSGPVAAAASSGADGSYSFPGLPAGTYVVCVSPQIAYWQTLPMEGAYCDGSGTIGYILVIGEGQTITLIGNDFGQAPIQ